MSEDSLRPGGAYATVGGQRLGKDRSQRSEVRDQKSEKDGGLRTKRQKSEVGGQMSEVGKTEVR